MSEIKDSGARREFGTGAVRDIDEQKGRCDLLPLKCVAEIIGGPVETILTEVIFFVESRKTSYLASAIRNFAEINGWDIYTAMLEVSIHYADGCRKYGERNWERGIPLHSFIDSGVRHLLKWARGDKDERHDRAFIWNMLGAIYTIEYKPEMDDLPVYNDKFDALMDVFGRKGE